MLDVVAFSELAQVGTLALQPTTGLPDDHVTVIGDNIIVPSPCNKVMAIYHGCSVAGADFCIAAQLSSPSLRATSVLDVAVVEHHGVADAAAAVFPCNLAGLIGTADTNKALINDYRTAPIELLPGEAMQYLQAIDVVPNACSTRAVIFLTDGDLGLPVKAPFNGRIETVVADGQAAAVAAVWSNSALVFRQALRAGTYALVGARIHSPTGVAGRFVLQGTTARPGALCVNGSVGTLCGCDQQDPLDGGFRYGRTGVWGYFRHDAPPVMQLLCGAADAAVTQVVALDVIKVS